MVSSEVLPRVGVIQGSDSDLGPVMQHVGRALRDSGFAERTDYEDRIVSAHRTEEEMMEYAAEAEGRGIQVIVAGAGGSAHLPGMVASGTLLPVLGVAVTSHPEVMNRALGSMIGMPEGKTLATFQTAVGAYNAGLFAAQVLRVKELGANRIGVVMSSKDDYATMKHVGRALTILGLEEGRDYDEDILHTDQDIEDYSESISGSRFAAVISSSPNTHRLPVKLAGKSKVPVIGVAITDNPDVMSSGLNQLVNAHAGEAMAAVQGSAGAFNAGLHAVRILALANPDLRRRSEAYGLELKHTVLAKDSVLRRLGAQAYLALTKQELNQAIETELKSKQEGVVA